MIWNRRTTNYWPDTKCAKAFWSQHELPPYRQLLADTTARLAPQAGERWLDLGCGRGMLTKGIFQDSCGTVAEITGIDIAPVNAQAYDKLSRELKAQPGQIRFVAGDFLDGLRQFASGSVDGIVSGLALSYAESLVDGRWTTSALDRTLAECRRVLAPRGRFVFSINVPEPAWGTVARDCLTGVWSRPRPHRYLVKAWRIWRYGGWLKREARRGRFHYLSAEALRAKLLAAGFPEVDIALSFSGQAYVVTCRPTARSVAA
ncbi:MAG: class I SAM-dependent methyltransferase [Gemmataceae bacterium]|nr:class I SAM-dependent methyltransferase [Gemmataceae bacterium]